MHHLVCRDVVQHEADGLGRIKAIRNRREFTLRQADVLGVGTMNWQSRNHLTDHRLRRFLSDLFHHTHQVPSRRIWQECFFRMDTLPHQQVREGHAGNEHAQPHLASPRLRGFFLCGFQNLRPAKTANDDTERFHDKALSELNPSRGGKHKEQWPAQDIRRRASVQRRGARQEAVQLATEQTDEFAAFHVGPSFEIASTAARLLKQGSECDCRQLFAANRRHMQRSCQGLGGLEAGHELL